MGGNDDYTGGMVFEATIREATWAAAQARSDRAIVLVNPQMAEQGWQACVEHQLDELTDADAVRQLVNRDPGVRWTSYVLGLFLWLKEHLPEHATRGMNVFIRSDVPLNKGVSSSAAVEVAVMKAAAHAYGVDLSGVRLAEACQWVENVIAESPCGIMDQIAVVLGDEGCVLPLVCQPCLAQPLVRLPTGLTCWGLDSGVRHQVSGVEYEAARAAGFMGYKLLCDSEQLPVTPEKVPPRFPASPTRAGTAISRISPRRSTATRRPTAARNHRRGVSRLTDAHVDPFTPACGPR